MKIGIGSYAFRWSVGTREFVPPVRLTPITLLEKSAACGAAVVQICENVPLDALAETELSRIRRKAADLGLVLELGVKGSDLAYLQRNLQVCHQLGSTLMRVVFDEPEPLESLIQTVRTLLPRLQALDIRLAIENHFCFTPAQLVEIVEAVGDPRIGICLDPLNSISRLIGPQEIIATLAPYALSVHVKDARTVRRGTGFWVCGCPLGEGLVDVRRLIAACREHGRSAHLLVEGWMDQGETPQATVEQEEQWIRQGIKYLQGLRMIDG